MFTPSREWTRITCPGVSSRRLPASRRPFVLAVLVLVVARSQQNRRGLGLRPGGACFAPWKTGVQGYDLGTFRLSSLPLILYPDAGGVENTSTGNRAPLRYGPGLKE